MKKSGEDYEVQKGKHSEDLRRHEREAYVEVRSTVIQSTIIRQVEPIDSG